MRLFWLDRELMDKEVRLLNLCLGAHAKSAGRENVSSTVIKAAAYGSQDYTKAIVAGLSCLGGVHAPLIDTWRVLMDQVPVAEALKAGIKIPGWGSSFAAEDVQIWGPVGECLKEHWQEIWGRVEAVTALLKAAGKDLQPNPSALTAATGIALQMPPQILAWFFIQGRLDAWTIICFNAMKGGG